MLVCNSKNKEKPCSTLKDKQIYFNRSFCGLKSIHWKVSAETELVFKVEQDKQEPLILLGVLSFLHFQIIMAVQWRSIGYQHQGRHCAPISRTAKWLMRHTPPGSGKEPPPPPDTARATPPHRGQWGEGNAVEAAWETLLKATYW